MTPLQPTAVAQRTELTPPFGSETDSSAPSKTYVAAPDKHSLLPKTFLLASNFCAVAPKTYLVAPNFYAAPPKTYSVAPNFCTAPPKTYSAPKNKCAMPPKTYSVAANFWFLTRNHPYVPQFSNLNTNPKTIEPWHE